MKKYFILSLFVLFSTHMFGQVMAMVPSSGILCVGSTLHVTDTTGGGTWTSSNTAIATVGSTSGIITGVSLGVVTISYTVGTSYATGTFTVSSSPAPITSSSMVACTGSSLTLTDATPGGSWQSSTTSVAYIGSTTGVLTGVSTGTTTISYSIGTCYTTAVYTVDPTVTPITGSTPVCVGSAITLTDATPGGTWSSGGVSIATVGSTSGVVTGVSGGTVNITYSMGTPCPAIVAVSVETTPVTGTIVGSSTVCAGSTITLIDSSYMGGGIYTGTWTSSNTAIATAGTSGLITGVSAGTAIITFTATNACGSTSDTFSVTVSSSTPLCIISGPSSVAVGSPITLSASVSGGSWSSGTTSIATVGAGTGIVTGVSVGSDIIMYTYSGCGGSATVNDTITVTSFSGISGYVRFSSGFSGNVRVYLITYDPGTLDLEAIDSVTNPCSGDSVYYQFTGLSTDSFRVKAWAMDTGSGYIPTYHDTSFYWDWANVINYVAGTGDTYEDIDMMSGVSTSGTGFIGGNVLSGANRGTSTGIPVVGMRMMVVNSTTNQLMGMATTDGSGNYTFSNLPTGQTYFVFPDSLNYYTTPYTAITLTSSSSTMSTANFMQHTISKTITPLPENVQQVAQAVSYVATVPNPVSGALNIMWNEPTTEQATMTITDVAGHAILKTSFSMAQGSGTAQFDLSEVANGLYIVNIKSATVNYAGKIEVQH